MKILTITTGIILIVLLGIDLHILDRRNKEILEQNIKLKKEYNDLINTCITMEALNVDNLSQSFKEIIIDKKLNNKSLLSLLSEDNNKLIVRFDMQECPTCLNTLKAFIKSLGKEIGYNKILILPIGKEKRDLKILQNDLAPFVVLDTPMNHFYVQGTEDHSEPYIFVYNKDYKYPLLFFYFRAEFAELNKRYFKSVTNYFNYKMTQNE